MAANVRAYTHAGMQALPVASFAGQPSNTNQFMLKQPYLHAEVLTASTGAAVSSTPETLAPTTDNNVKVLYVQVQPGKRVHYEVTPHGHSARTATTSSPIMLDGTVLSFGPGWAISVLEAEATA
jgi:hypothetical protein